MLENDLIQYYKFIEQGKNSALLKQRTEEFSRVFPFLEGESVNFGLGGFTWKDIWILFSSGGKFFIKEPGASEITWLLTPEDAKYYLGKELSKRKQEVLIHAKETLFSSLARKYQYNKKNEVELNAFG